MRQVGERLMYLVENPPEGMSFTCPRCEVRYPNAVPPANGICDGCHRRHRREGKRVDVLAAVGVPRRHAQEFVEPGPGGLQAFWPSTANGIPCTAWPNTSGWVLMLEGVTGAGKSAIAAELLWRAMRSRSCSGAWLRAADVADRTLSGKADELQSALDSPLLVVDELGIGHEAEAAWSSVENFLCRRWDRDLPTIITTNLSPAALVKRSAPLADRLRDGILCRMDGRSLRGAKR